MFSRRKIKMTYSLSRIKTYQGHCALYRNKLYSSTKPHAGFHNPACSAPKSSEEFVESDQIYQRKHQLPDQPQLAHQLIVASVAYQQFKMNRTQEKTPTIVNK